jgi:hypothetical protein
MGLGHNFTRVAVGPGAHGEKTLFIDGTSTGMVEPHIEILWIEAKQVQAAHKQTGATPREGAFAFHGLTLADGAEQRSLGDHAVTNSQWRVQLAAPDGFAEPETWISISGRMPMHVDGDAPDYVVWSNMLAVERAEPPK